MRAHTKRHILTALCAVLLLAALLAPSRAGAQTPYLGEIRMFAGNFAPRGWAFCNGQLLPIAQNSALFSLLGTTYGGDGRTTFALPDLRGRVPLHPGTGPGLTTRRLGEKSGGESVTLAVSQVPSHSHTVAPGAVSGQGNTSWPAGSAPAAGRNFHSTAAPDVSMRATVSTNTGGGQSHPNMQPYLGISFIIALQGVYPSM
jgi:microcystin-dependent protein